MNKRKQYYNKWNIGSNPCRGTGHRASENGITLIALIITIIVLLILAGVSINLIIGENGIINQAQAAVNTYKQKENEESLGFDALYNEFANYIPGNNQSPTDTIETAPASEINNWDYDLDTDNKKIYLTNYTGDSENVIVYGKYEVDGVSYDTILNSYDWESNPFYYGGHITSIVIKNGVTSEDCFYMFDGCSSLASLDLSGLDTSNVTDMRYMFNGCSSLASLNLSGLDTSNVTDMSYMFNGCKNLTSLNLSGFNTSNVTDMDNMFIDCSSLASLDLTSFDTSKVKDMNNMFAGCKNLTSLNLSSFNTSIVTDMHWMFFNCTSLSTLDLSSFNTSKVKDMNSMFCLCANLTTIFVTPDKWITSQAATSDMFDDCGTLDVTPKE